MNNFTKYPGLPRFLTISFLSSLILALHFLASPVFAQPQPEPDAETLQCASRLFGSMSQEHCEATCKTGGQHCKTITKIKGDSGDIDCYVCPRDESCHDIGLDDWIDCFNCDMNPKTECINAGWMPPGGFPGAPSGPIGGKTPGGTQCFKCVNKPDKCAASFPGTTWKATCDATCFAPKKCNFAGVAPDGFDCYKCVEPKAETCKDLKLLSNADCAACNADPKTQCVAAGFTKTWEACFKCVLKNLPPPPPPPKDCHAYMLVNNCNVCTFLDKDCEFVKVDDTLTCARCKDKPKKKECEPPDLNLWECQKCERDGGVCVGRTHARGEPDCYYCYKQNIPPPPTSCDEYHMPASCSPNPCSEDEDCVMSKMSKSLECAECIPRDDIPSTCDKYKMMSDCATCYRAQMACSPHFVPELGANCFKCYWPREPDSCQDLGFAETCTPNPCSEGQECVRHTPTKGLVCAACLQKKEDECPHGTSQGACPGSCSSQEVCVAEGDNCHSCEQKKVEEVQCKQGFAPGVCPGSCSSNQECVADGNCHACQKKKISCEDQGLSDGDTCIRNCPDGKCVQGREDDFGTRCWECQKKTVTQPECRQGFVPGACPGSCSSNQECAADGNCHACREKPRVALKHCDEMGKMYLDQCNQSCVENGGVCKHDGVDEYGTKCFKCNQRSAQDRCSFGFIPGQCFDITCSESDMCVESTRPGKKVCHKCQPIVSEGCAAAGYIPGGCPGTCDSTQECVNVKVGQEQCHICPIKERIKCHIGEWPGTCPGNCDTTTSICIQDGPCYFCDQNPTFTQPKKRCADYDLYDDCIACGWRSMDCVDKSPATDLYCKECKPNACRPHLTKDECKKCNWENADCSPVDKNGKFYPAGATIERGSGPQCYECDYGERCEDYGLVCNCYSCRPGTLCVPADRLYDGKICYACLKNVTVTVEYVIFIFDTPFGRYVLDKNKTLPSELGDFVPRKVMALAKLEEVNGVKQVAGFLKGGVNAAGMIPVNMENLTSTLQSALSSGGKFTESCFKDFKAAEVQEKIPAGSESTDQKKNKKKKGDEPAAQVAQGYGEDPLANVTITGPVFACGESSGKKALMVLDAGGNPTGLITQEAAKKSPDALKAAIQKAQSASETFLSLKSGGWQQLVKKYIGGFIDRGVSEVKEIVKDKKKKKKEEPEVQLDPNDPLYEKPEKGKKKRFLGILGGDSPSTPVVIGSMMKSGGRVLGAGAEVHKDKEPKTDYQWGLYTIGFTPKSDPQSAWNAVDADEKNVIVAVIDSGLDFTHPDGPRYIWKNPGETPDNKIDDDQNGYVDDVQGWSFLDNNNDLRDFRGHGTFVAGIIAARSNNGQGIAGINPGAVIMPLKVANEEGKANSFDIYRAIHYAVSHGARVINISMGARSISLMEQAAINTAREMNVFVAVASGNVGENISDHGPASASGVFSVGAVDISGERSTISNWGGNNGLLAPAEEIYSLLSMDAADRVLPSLRKLGYHTESGTSFSTPMVAATASLILVKHPNYTPADIEDVLQRTATDMYEEGWDGKSGAGLLNAAAALRDEVQSKLTVKLNALKKNLNDDKKFESIDVTATVRGDLDQFTISVGRGIHPGSFKPVAGPFKMEANKDWVARINDSDMRGSTDWVIRIEATDRTGKKYFAESAVDLK